MHVSELRTGQEEDHESPVHVAGKLIQGKVGWVGLQTVLSDILHGRADGIDEACFDLQVQVSVDDEGRIAISKIELLDFSY